MTWQRVSDPSYVTVHQRLTRERGRASVHQCVQCGEQARDWAFDYSVEVDGMRPYSEDLSRYQPMCRACHLKHDAEKRTHCFNGHEWSEKNTYLNSKTGWRFCRTCRREYMRSYRVRKQVS